MNHERLVFESWIMNDWSWIMNDWSWIMNDWPIIDWSWIMNDWPIMNHERLVHESWTIGSWPIFSSWIMNDWSKCLVGKKERMIMTHDTHTQRVRDSLLGQATGFMFYFIVFFSFRVSLNQSSMRPIRNHARTNWLSVTHKSHRKEPICFEHVQRNRRFVSGTCSRLRNITKHTNREKCMYTERENSERKCSQTFLRETSFLWFLLLLFHPGFLCLSKMIETTALGKEGHEITRFSPVTVSLFWSMHFVLISLSKHSIHRTLLTRILYYRGSQFMHEKCLSLTMSFLICLYQWKKQTVREPRFVFVPLFCLSFLWFQGLWIF